jgi:TolB-like protein
MKTTLSCICLLLAAAFILLASGCGTGASNPVRIRDGVAYGKTEGNFRHRWWNYYERGLSYADGQFYAEAAADLSTALKARDNDQRMARTYGHHFIDYFPNRELGIIHYLTGELNRAKDALEHSIDQYPSAKARFYLDRVRKAIIEEQSLDVTPPQLFLDAADHELWTRDDPVIISGSAEDQNFVSRLVIGGKPIFLEGAKESVLFSEPLSLSQGRHNIEISAMNLAQQSSQAGLIIHVDRQGPMVILEDLPSGGSLLRGSVHDDAGVTELVINGQTVSIENNIEAPFSFALPLGIDQIAFRATDSLGNTTFSKIRLQEWTAIRPQLLLASAGPVDTLHLAAHSGKRTRQDKRPPVITLDKLTNNQTVFLEKIYIEGRVRDESSITRLAINNVPILRREGKLVFFNHIAELQEGVNYFIIEAEDDKGKRAVKKIRLKKQTPEVMLLDERMRLAVLPYERKGAVSNASLSFQDNLISALFDQNRFQVIEREIMDTVLQEHKLDRSELADGKSRFAGGKIALAQSIITGSIIETHTGIEIVSRMIDTETAEIIAIEDVYNEARDLPSIKSLAQGTAIKFHLDFPLIIGDIIEALKKDVLFNIGKKRLRFNRRIIVFKETPVIHAETGHSLGTNSEIVDHARITQIGNELSKAEMYDGRSFKTDHTYKVITE